MKIFKYLAVLVVVTSLVSFGYACSGGPGCACPSEDQAAQKASCGADCEKACCASGKSADQAVKSCGTACSNACSADKNMGNSSLIEGNVWTTASGTKYFTCPVSNTDGTVDKAVSYSDVEGVRYYHCCSGCELDFSSNPSSFLKDTVLPANISTIDQSGKKEFLDPVNMKKGSVAEKTLHYDYEGKRYYFSSKRTLKKFKRNPEKYFS